jgi:hypothetical protein
MAQILKMKLVEKDDRGRWYCYRQNGHLRIRAFDNQDGVTFRVFRNDKEITIRDMDFPHKLSKKQERLIAEALDHTYRHGRINGADD